MSLLTGIMSTASALAGVKNSRNTLALIRDLEEWDVENDPTVKAIDDSIQSFLESCDERRHERQRIKREERERREREERERNPRTFEDFKSSSRYGWHSGMDTL